MRETLNPGGHGRSESPGFTGNVLAARCGSGGSCRVRHASFTVENAKVVERSGQSTSARERLRAALFESLGRVPEIRNVVLSSDSLAAKRSRLKRELSRKLNEDFDAMPVIAPLEWVLQRDAVEVLRSILRVRSERLAGFSLLGYLDRLAADVVSPDLAEPTPAFLGEIDHLMRGIAGQAGLYPERRPAFANHTGRRAAALRSEDLSRMAQGAMRWAGRYPSGLAPEIRARRARNRRRVCRGLGGGESDWLKWRWHVRNVVQDADRLARLVRLSHEEAEAIRLARAHHIPFGITPHYLTLFDRNAGGDRDRAVRAQVIPSMHYVRRMIEGRARGETSTDFMLESSTSPVEGVTRRYPKVVILKPFLTCPQICIYCQRNWQIEDVHSTRAALGREALERALDWIDETPEISEVLVTGGDPLLLPDSQLERILDRLAANPNIERIRVGTRMLVTLPQRVTDPLADLLARHHEPGRREVVVVTHFESLYELTPESVEAVGRLRRRGLDVLNQLVYTLFNSRRFEAADLRHRLRLAGVSPYYTFNTKGKRETDDFRVPIARLLQEQKEEARIYPGTVRTDETVFNVPGLGKNYLRAAQHHDVIAILPSGRRVYEFHPWEKKLALADTYVYTDVVIHDYLERLKRIGESPGDYRSIWYYY